MKEFIFQPKSWASREPLVYKITAQTNNSYIAAHKEDVDSGNPDFREFCFYKKEENVTFFRDKEKLKEYLTNQFNTELEKI